MTAAKRATAKASGSADETSSEPEFSNLKVTAARIQVTIGSQVLQFSEGDVLPKGIADETVKRLTDRGLIEKN